MDNIYENIINYYTLDIILGIYNIKCALFLELMFLDKMKTFTLKKKSLIKDGHITFSFFYLLAYI